MSKSATNKDYIRQYLMAGLFQMNNCQRSLLFRVILQGRFLISMSGCLGWNILQFPLVHPILLALNQQLSH
jgi:hypothetical protein